MYADAANPRLFYNRDVQKAGALRYDGHRFVVPIVLKARRLAQHDKSPQPMKIAPVCSTQMS
jgi:hypothetical protein